MYYILWNYILYAAIPIATIKILYILHWNIINVNCPIILLKTQNRIYVLYVQLAYAYTLYKIP